MGCGTRVAGALLALALLVALAWPVVAVEEPPTYTVPPHGTVMVAYAVSDGMTMLPAGVSTIPPGTFCP